MRRLIRKSCLNVPLKHLYLTNALPIISLNKGATPLNDAHMDSAIVVLKNISYYEFVFMLIATHL